MQEPTYHGRSTLKINRVGFGQIAEALGQRDLGLRFQQPSPSTEKKLDSFFVRVSSLAFGNIAWD
jgi:hypothetical protein